MSSARPLSRRTSRLVAALLALTFVAGTESLASAAYAEDVPDGPVILTEPQDVTATVGDPVALTVEATGAEGYQWQVSTDGVDDADAAKVWTDLDPAADATATTPTLSIDAVALSDAGDYRVVVTGGDGAADVVSSAALLTVVEPATETTEPEQSDESTEDPAEEPAEEQTDDPAEAEEPEASAGTGASEEETSGSTADAAPDAAAQADATEAAGALAFTEDGDLPAELYTTFEDGAVPGSYVDQFLALSFIGSDDVSVQWYVVDEEANGTTDPVVWETFGLGSGLVRDEATGALALEQEWFALSTDHSSYQAKDGQVQTWFVITDGDATLTSTVATWYIAVPPTVTTQPADVSTALGGSATFTAAFSGYPAPSIQWQYSATGDEGSFTDLAGETAATLTVTDAQQAGSYRAVGTNRAGSVATAAAGLTVGLAIVEDLPATFDLVQPHTGSVTLGDQAWSLTYTGSAGTTVTWYVRHGDQEPIVATADEVTSGVDADGHTTSELRPTLIDFPVADAADWDGDVQVWAELTEGGSTVTSQVSTLRVTTEPVFVDEPEDLELHAGEAGTLSVQVAAYPAAELTWEVSENGVTGWTTVDGETEAELDVTAQSTDRFYRVTASNRSGSDASRVLRVETVPESGQELIAEGLPDSITVVDRTATMLAYGSITKPTAYQSYSVTYKVTETTTLAWYSGAATGGSQAQSVAQGNADGTAIFYYTIDGVDSDGYVTTTLHLSADYWYLASFNAYDYQFWVVVSDSATGVTQQSRTTVTWDADRLTASPQNLHLDAAGEATFTATNRSYAQAPLVWQSSTDDGATWTDLADQPATTYVETTSVAGTRHEYVDGTSTLTVAATDADSGTRYRAVFTTGSGALVTSRGAELTLGDDEPSGSSVRVTQDLPAETIALLSRLADDGYSQKFAYSLSAEVEASASATITWKRQRSGSSTVETLSGTSWVYDSGAETWQATLTGSVNLSYAAQSSWYGAEVWAEIEDEGVVVSTARTVLKPVYEIRVTEQPVSAEVAVGTTHTLRVDVTDNDPEPSIQWQYSETGADGTWSDLAGETGAALVLADVQGTGWYRVVLTSEAEQVTTPAARITAVEQTAGLTVTAQPQPVTAVDTYAPDVTFTATVAAPGATTAQWQYSSDNGLSWQAVPDADATLSDDGTTATLHLTQDYSVADLAELFADGVLYRAVLTGDGASATTDAARLTVVDSPKLRVTTEGPYSRGQTVTVSGEGFGTTGSQYSYVSGSTVYLQVTYPGWTYSATVVADTVTVNSDGTFTAQVTIPSRAGDAVFPLEDVRVVAYQAVSSPYLVYSPTFDLVDRSGDVTTPTIVTDLEDVAGDVGDTVELTVEFTGGAGTQVQWYYARNTEQGVILELSSLNDISTEYDAESGIGTSTLRYPLSDSTAIGAYWYAVITNDAGSVQTRSAYSSLPSAPTLKVNLAETLLVGVGEQAVLNASANAAPRATVTWERSDDGGATWTTVTDQTGITSAHSSGVTTGRYVLTATADDDGAQFRATFTNSAGTVTTRVLTLTASSEDVPVTVTANPESQSIESGESVTFTASGSGVPAPTVQWQRSTDGGTTWTDLRGATSTSYTIEKVDEDEDGYAYRAVFTNSAGLAATVAATLTVTERNNIRTSCGTSYGPSGYSGDQFCISGPEKIVVGEDIVITGTGYLATDDVTGSVVNFFLDALYSGDPNTVTSKQTFTNPATGKAITDNRTNAVVQANADGTWTATIKWPTADNVNLTQAEIDELFAAGTTHSVRVLTGSLLTSPADRQRGISLYFTVVNSLDDEVDVTEPIYEHLTTDAFGSDDSAVAWIPTNVDSGGSFKLTGTGWLTKDQQWGSSVSVRLQDETGAYYQHAGTADDPYPVADDPTVWQVVQAAEDGVIDTTVDVPTDAVAGDYLAVELTTSDDGTALGDVERHWVGEALSIDETPYVPELSDDATCTAGSADYTYELDPGRENAAANVGGTIRLTGTSWCNLVGTGSLVAVKINAGGYSHTGDDVAQLYDARTGEWTGDCPATVCSTNATIWVVIQADDTGSFDVEIPLPDRTNSNPKFAEGSYTLQLLTRTISADSYYAGTVPDPSRSVQTREFTAVAEGESLDDVTPGAPTAIPDPLLVSQDLTDATTGGVRVDQQSDRWVVTVPGAAEGDWVYVNVYADSSARDPWATQWFQVDANHQVVLPLAGAAIPTGTNRLSVQDRDGDLLGWTWVTVATVDAAAAAGTDGAATVTATSSSGISYYAPSSSTGEPKPGTTPDAPVGSYTELDESNVGDLTAVTQDGNLIVTIPSVEGGHWVYLYLYTQDGQVVGVDWVQVGTDHTITVQIGSLPAGTHKLAVLDEDGTLLGWVTATGSEVLAGTDDTGSGTAGGTTAEDATATVVPAALTSDLTWTLVLVGLALLVLAGSIAGVVVLRTPPRARRAGPPTTTANQG